LSGKVKHNIWWCLDGTPPLQVVYGFVKKPKNRLRGYFEELAKEGRKDPDIKWLNWAVCDGISREIERFPQFREALLRVMAKYGSDLKIAIFELEDF